VGEVLTLPRRFKRPMPPRDIVAFQPAPDLIEWIEAVFIDESGPLFNPRYNHLRHAQIGCLWSDIPNRRNMREIVGQAELMPPMAMGKWQRARAEFQIEEWFGELPDFLITFSAGFAMSVDDGAFCAVVEHELHHCAQDVDVYGAPKFTRDGAPKFAIRGHDVEEFVGVVERYGATATVLEAMRLALNSKPTVGLASIAAACGTCQGKRRA
jgi:hypothetical protein